MILRHAAKVDIAMAGLLACEWHRHLPSRILSGVACWLIAYSCGDSRGIETSLAPHSLVNPDMGTIAVDAKAKRGFCQLVICLSGLFRPH